MEILEITQKSFDDVISNNNIVVIEFWASWCQPCKSFAKIFRKVAEQHDDKLFASVNIEQETELTEEFAIKSVPFVMVIKEKTIVYAETGALTETALCDLVEQAGVLEIE